MPSTACFDERDNVFSRRDLKPGTPEYEDFYRRHPEWKDADDLIRSRPGLGTFAHPADSNMFYAASWLMRRVGAPDYVDGEPAEKKIEMSPEQATRKVKALARQLGADLVGVSRMNPAYAFSHRGRVFYPEEPWGSSIEVSHEYAISLGFREDVHLVRTAPHIGEMVDSGLHYLRSAIVAVALAQYIRSLGYPARAHHFRNYQVLSVPLAVEAGLGELARCGFLLTRQFGNCLRLSTVTTDFPLLCDSPIDIGVDDFCTRCKLCAEACPCEAIPMNEKSEIRGASKWQINDVKCYDYWMRVGTDCGICIASCPWSQPDVWYHRSAALLASKSELARILLLRLHPIMYGKYRPGENPEWLEPRNRGDEHR